MKSGLTLVEIIIALAIFLILASISLPLLGGWPFKVEASSANAQLIQTIRLAREQSISGLNNKKHGVFFDNNSYTLFQGDSYASRQTGYDSTTTLDRGLSLSWQLTGITGQANEIVFNQAGIPSRLGKIVINSETGVVSDVYINKLGILGQIDLASPGEGGEEPCIPACAGKICGDDGCGDTCAPNSCSGDTPACSPDGTCIAMTECASAVCGDGTNLSCGASDFMANGSLTLNSDNASAYQSTITYQAVKIGTQCWLDKNINIGVMDTGHIMDARDASAGIKRYCYNDTMTNCDNSPYDGGIYTWTVAMYLPTACNTSVTGNCEPLAYVTGYGASAKRQGICPKGWHLPSDYEWWYLEDYAQRIATPMSSPLVSDAPDYYADQVGTGGKSGHRGTSEEKLRSPSGSTNLKFPFAGRWNGAFSGRVDEAFIWSSSQSYDLTSWYRYLYRGYAPPRRDHPIKVIGQSVRCLKD